MPGSSRASLDEKGLAGIVALLSSMFSAEEFWQFVNLGPHGAEICLHLSERDPVGLMIARTVSRLDRMGLLDRSFFMRVAEARPRRSLELLDVAITIVSAQRRRNLESLPQKNPFSFTLALALGGLLGASFTTNMEVPDAFTCARPEPSVGVLSEHYESPRRSEVPLTEERDASIDGRVAVADRHPVRMVLSEDRLASKLREVCPLIKSCEVERFEAVQEPLEAGKYRILFDVEPRGSIRVRLADGDQADPYWPCFRDSIGKSLRQMSNGFEVGESIMVDFRILLEKMECP